jgi:hypothetical protein
MTGLTLLLQIVPVAQGRDRMRTGEYLPVGGSFSSNNGQFQAILSESSVFGVWRKGDKGALDMLWSSKTGNTWVSKLCLDWNERLVLYGKDSKAVWEQKTKNPTGEAELVLQNDGKLVLSRKSVPFWSTEITVSTLQPSAHLLSSKLQYIHSHPNLLDHYERSANR